MEIIDVGLKFKGTLTKRTKTNEIILHHAAGNGTVQAIHNYHINGNGWLGIGYHFYVRKDGSVYRGRPEEMVGGHTYGQNNESIGICFEGNFENEKMSLPQKQAGGELVGYLLDRYESIVKVSRHKDYNATACPGKNFPYEDILCIASGYENNGGIEDKTENAVESNKAGEKLILENEPLYVSAYDESHVDRVSGTYYRWDGETVKGKIKITNRAERVGKYGQVTGWIDEPREKLIHKVVSGDTLSALAQKYGSTVDGIYNANRDKYPAMTKNYILVGWELEIPR